jgi:hypothetical protein
MIDDEEGKILEALNFIRNAGRKIGSSELVEHMQHKAPWRLRTGESITRQTIIPILKKRGSIIIPRHRPGQKQYLIFNHKSEYDRIVSVTDKIKTVIDAMDEPIERLLIQRAEWTAQSDTEEVALGVNFLRRLHEELEFKYLQGYKTMLQFLWDRTNSTIPSEKDKQTLHTKIASLMMKVNNQFWNYRQLHQIFKFLTFDPVLSDNPLSKKMGITKELIEQLNTTKEEFVTLFELG